jgi:omega-6 fatty acid desaturase (delta-12 desaturase)
MNQSREVNFKVYTNGIPKPLPDTITLSDVIKSMPKEVFQKNMWKAWSNVLITILAVALSEWFIMISPWYLLPFAWAFAGTAYTGFFVIGHDCGHFSFARSHLLNDIVGILSFLIFFYPFESWRIQHNLHHNNTNKLHVDNAWQPFQQDYFNKASPSERSIMTLIKGPFWYFASIGHWIKEHFFLSSFEEKQLNKVKISLAVVYIAAAIFFPTMLYNVGIWGLVKYWFIPFLGYHFWMSTFTMIHHTLPHIPFLPEEKWSDVKARLTMTVHCEYPYWIEFLTHHINVHIPHHVSTSIPSYNLRMAFNSLKVTYGKHLQETVFCWELLKDVITTCHLYDEKEIYIPFSEADVYKQGKKDL